VIIRQVAVSASQVSIYAVTGEVNPYVGNFPVCGLIRRLMCMQAGVGLGIDAAEGAGHADFL
jgi:hypothetical protein